MPAHAPLHDPVLLFLHTFSLKSAHVGGQNPPKMGPRPPLRKILDPALAYVVPLMYIACILMFTRQTRALYVAHSFNYLIDFYTKSNCPDCLTTYL